MPLFSTSNKVFNQQRHFDVFQSSWSLGSILKCISFLPSVFSYSLPSLLLILVAFRNFLLACLKLPLENYQELKFVKKNWGVNQQLKSLFFSLCLWFSNKWISIKEAPESSLPCFCHRRTQQEWIRNQALTGRWLSRALILDISLLARQK